MRFYRVDLADLFRGSLSFRRLRSLLAYLPLEAATSVALGGDGFSMLELLVMENGMSGGSLNPRHPWSDVKRATSTAKTLSDRQAFYDQQRRDQSARAAANQQDADREDGQPHASE